MPKVDIGIACSSNQVPYWWSSLMNEVLGSQKLGVEIGATLTISSAVPDHNKNNVMTSDPWTPEEKKRADLTDANRVEMTRKFLDGDADYIFMVDDDTVPPSGALLHMLDLGRDAVSGLYFNPKPPYNPIAYIRHPSGLYHSYYGYIKGSLQQVDSVGMGCTLIHRSVFEKIQDAFEVFQRSTGSLVAIHKDDIVEDPYYTATYEKPMVVNGILHTPLLRLEPDENENRAFPFFALEYGRTEDHHFWEMAERVGVKPWLDTTIECEHIKPRSVTKAHYDEYIKRTFENGKYYPSG